MKLTKTYLYNITVGEFYGFRLYQVVDAQKNIYYIGEPVDRGATKTADTIKELREKLEAQVPLLNNFLRRVR